MKQDAFFFCLVSFTQHNSFYFILLDLQYCVSFRYAAKRFGFIFIYLYIYIFQIIFQHRLLQDIEYIFLNSFICVCVYQEFTHFCNGLLFYHTNIQFVHFSVDGYLGCSHFCDITNKTAKNILKYVFIWTYVSLLFGKYLEEELLRVYVSITF